MSRRRPSARFLSGRSRTLVAGLGGAALLVVLVLAWLYVGPGPHARRGSATLVELAPGSGVRAIAETLKGAGVIRSGVVFIGASKTVAAGRTLKAGEYEIPSGASTAAIIRQLQAGRVIRHAVTVPEGLTSAMVADILNAAAILTGQVEAPEEGSLLPETYDVRRGEDRAAVLARMSAAHDKVLAELWAARKPGLPFQTPQEAVTLASIVEKETSKAAERPHVASVYINRLRQGMRLGADPTVIYGLTGGRPLGRGILLSELHKVTPYNTYAIDGLPKGPICNPGKASLAAVLNPEDSSDLYFVADGTGGHVFAATAAEHERNVARWRQIEKTNPAWTAPSAPTAAAKGK